MTSHGTYPNRIEDFISAQVIRRGLDERTARAYRMDLEKFYVWLEAAEVHEPFAGMGKPAADKAD